jgi:hypothetical protein
MYLSRSSELGRGGDKKRSGYGSGDEADLKEAYRQNCGLPMEIGMLN